MPANPLQPIIDLILYGVLWLIPVILAGIGLKALVTARRKGAAGERAVRRVLDRLGQATLHDVILPDGRGGLTQIDHLALTLMGLLVVETKNYAGPIFGQVRDASWTQRLGRQRFTFQNPLRQNYLHVQALKALIPDAPLQGRVVFTDRARFPKGMPEGVSTVSTLRADLKPWCQAGAVSAELQDAWSRIVTAARTDRASRKAHLAALRERHGRDWRKVIAVGLLLVAAVWLAVLVALRVLFLRRLQIDAFKSLPRRVRATGNRPDMPAVDLDINASIDRVRGAQPVQAPEE